MSSNPCNCMDYGATSRSRVWWSTTIEPFFCIGHYESSRMTSSVESAKSVKWWYCCVRLIWMRSRCRLTDCRRCRSPGVAASEATLRRCRQPASTTLSSPQSSEALTAWTMEPYHALSIFRSGQFCLATSQSLAESLVSFTFLSVLFGWWPSVGSDGIEYAQNMLWKATGAVWTVGCWRQDVGLYHWTLPALHPIYCWQVTHYVDKLSAIGQPTRPTQPSTPLGSVNE